MNKTLREDKQNPEIHTIKMAMKETKSKRVFERYQAILLYLHGVTYDQNTLALADSEKQEQFKQDFETVKKIDSARN